MRISLRLCVCVLLGAATPALAGQAAGAGPPTVIPL